MCDRKISRRMLNQKFNLLQHHPLSLPESELALRDKPNERAQPRSAIR
jgi:hypothetical protein